MNIYLSSSISNKFDSIRFGLLELNVSVEPTREQLWEIIGNQINIIKSSLKLDEVNKIENIAATRDFYKKCGKDPNRYRPSADSLMRRIIKGNGLYKVNNVVDVLNLISAKSGISIGGYDISKIVGEVQLDIGTSEDEYSGIGRGTLNIEGLPVLRDESGVFGSPTSDSERTMINEKSKKVCFVFFDFGEDGSLEKHLDETANLLLEFADASDINKRILQL